MVAVDKRMVSDARRMANDLRKRWMRWVNVVASCCCVLMGNNETDLLLLRLNN